MADAGQALVEYALVIALVAIVAIVVLLLLGDQVGAILSTLGAWL
jgi:Flp pilus assembly pilin Flp